MLTTIRVSRAQLSLPDTLAALLPTHLYDAVRRCGAPAAEELRLHSDRISTVTANGKSYSTGVKLSRDELQELFVRLCGGSLYAYTEQIKRGYITLAGGVRVGVCGSAAVEDGKIVGVSHITSLILRIPHAVEVDAEPILRLLQTNQSGGILIYAPPGVGKTTLLRSVARLSASPSYGLRTVAVDTRGELSPTLDGDDLTLDILQGYPLAFGIEIAVRTMGAGLVLCDEIGNEDDARAIAATANCGVPLIATAHAHTARELLARPPILRLHELGIFHSYVGLQRANGGFLYTVESRNALQTAQAPVGSGTS